MDAETFVRYIEGYYGAFKRPPVRSAALRWAEGYRGNLALVVSLVIGEYSTTWGRVPDVAKIKDIIRENREQLRYLALPDGGERTKQISEGEYVDKEEGLKLIREVVEDLANRKRVDSAEQNSTGDRRDRVRGDAERRPARAAS